MKGQLRISFKVFIAQFYQPVKAAFHFCKQQFVSGQVFAQVQEKQRHALIVLNKGIVQGIFLQAIHFSHQSFDTISIYRLFKIPAANPNAGLQCCSIVLRQPENLEWKN